MKSDQHQNNDLTLKDADNTMSTDPRRYSRYVERISVVLLSTSGSHHYIPVISQSWIRVKKLPGDRRAYYKKF